MALKFLNRSSVRKWMDVVPSPFKSVNPITAVYKVGYNENSKKVATKGMLKI